MSAWQKSAALLVIIAWVWLGAAPAAAENTLAAARDLYAAAAYEDALTVLNHLRELEHGPEEERTIQQYRAFCLLALGRTADAEQAIEAVIIAQPSYQPSNADVSPRVRSTFTDVRRRMLPTIIQQQYAIAKAAYDRRDYAEAADRFKQVLAVLADPDVAPRAAVPPLSDMRVLASGFRDLAVIAATPPPPPPPVAPPPEPPRPAVAAPPPPPAPPHVYTSADANVVPPVVVRQWLPPFPTSASLPARAQGVIEVVINEAGAVEQATMRVPLNPAYDRQAISAARSWQYRPATVNGVPVKFRKAVQISVQR
jgi:TonB family protein